MSELMVVLLRCHNHLSHCSLPPMNNLVSCQVKWCNIKWDGGSISGFIPRPKCQEECNLQRQTVAVVTVLPLLGILTLNDIVRVHLFTPKQNLVLRFHGLQRIMCDLSLLINSLFSFLINNHHQCTQTKDLIAENEAPPRIVPIVALNPYQGRWTIKAKGTAKTQLRYYNIRRGDGKVFSFDLDSGVEIRVTCFNSVADQFYDQIEHLQKSKLQIL